MSIALSCALAAGLLVSCSKRPSAETTTTDSINSPRTPGDYPLVVIDEQHQMQGSNKPVAYQISASPGIRINTGEFKHSYGTNAVRPNMVQVMGRGAAYRLSQLVETNIYVIDRTTMEVARGGPFLGFRSGDKLLFAMGRSTRSADKEDFWVTWVGSIDVK